MGVVMSNGSVRRRRLFLNASTCALMLLSSVSACAQKPGQNAGAPESKPQPTPAAGALRHYEIKPSDLPPPNASPDAENGPRVIPRPAGAELQLPPGFKVNVYAEGGEFKRPRWMALAPNGDVFVADHTANSIFILRDTDNDGVAETRFTFVTNLNLPFGMAFWKDYFYVANTNAIVRFRYKVGQTKAEGEPEKVADLPGRGYREHWTRNIIFSPD